MSMFIRVSAFATLVLAGLAGCAGGGGGGGGGAIGQSAVQAAPPEVSFSSFSATGPNQTSVMPGMAQTLVESNVPVDATAKITYDATGRLSGIAYSTPQSSRSFSGSQISERFTPEGKRTSYVAFDGPSSVSIIDPAFFGWNYQSFGTWMEDINPFAFGAISAGAVTPANGVPTTGIANFTGHAGGIYIDGGNRYGTDASMRAAVDFENRLVQFSTVGTTLTPIGTAAPSTLDPSTLNLGGALNYAPGTNQFSGAVNTADGALKGNATGRFYGPNAQEIGGTYGLGSADGKKMVGGFGGKQ